MIAEDADPTGRRLMVSVVVPAYNEEVLLGDTLACIRSALLGAGLAAERFEIVVCDNASSDATAARAVQAGARLVREPVRQIARARNAGAAVARGDWMVFVDADSRPDPGLMREVLECITRGGVAGGGATLAMTGVGLGPRLLLGAWNRLSRSCRWMAGSFLFCRAEAFRALHGFNESLYAAEDIDFSVRLGRWARGRGERIRILHRHPLLTSSRKLDLYSGCEILIVLGRALRHPRRFFRDPSLCFPWYDGRR